MENPMATPSNPNTQPWRIARAVKLLLHPKSKQSPAPAKPTPKS